MKRDPHRHARQPARALAGQRGARGCSRAAGYEPSSSSSRPPATSATDVSLATIGGKGLFIKELEEALERGDDRHRRAQPQGRAVDHPGALRRWPAFLERADPRDAWVQPTAARSPTCRRAPSIGTSAPRRRAQLRRAAPAPPRRGHPRQRRHAHAQSARRPVRRHRPRRRRPDAPWPRGEITSYFSIDEMLPAAGQGIVAIECLASNASRRRRARDQSRAERVARRCERGVLQKFGTRLDCYSPVAPCISVRSATVLRAFVSETAAARRSRGRGVAAVDAATRPSAQVAGSCFEPERSISSAPDPATRACSRCAPRSSSRAADLVALDALVSKDIAARIPKPRRSRVRRQARQRARAAAGPDQPAAHRRGEEGEARRAAQGRRPVRLRARRRGGEELRRRGRPVRDRARHLSAIAGPAYAGIPVTHRAYATSVTLVTGARGRLRLDRHPLARARAARRHDRLHDGLRQPADDRATS